MKKLLIAAGALAAVATALAAAEDPIAARQTLMDSNGAAAAVAGGVLKGEIAFDPKVAKSTLASFLATATVFGDYFPEGSEDPSRSKADPKIWSDRAGFEAELTKFHDRAAAAVEAAGRAGPADVDAFKTAVGPVFDSCKTCHESYQVPD